MAGVLYLVATPIGNLEDITLRALRVLGEVDLVACEDTRRTSQLLAHFGIRARLISYHEHNEAARSRELLERLAAGANIALASDAGTPLVSDPGFRLVELASKAGIRIVPVPGPSAPLAALAASGLATDAFYFAGFLPARRSQRRKALEKLRDIPATLIFFEAPHRITETLEDIEAVLGERRVALAREITKLHEEFLRGSVVEIRKSLAERPPIKGEITLIVARGGETVEVPQTPLRQEVEALVEAGMSRMEAIKQVARCRGLSKREVYKEATVKGTRPRKAGPPPAEAS